MSSYSPTQEQIDEKTEEFLQEKIKSLDTDGILEALVQSEEHTLYDCLGKEYVGRLYLGFFQSVQSIVNGYYRPMAKLEAREWADQYEEDERAKYNDYLRESGRKRHPMEG